VPRSTEPTALLAWLASVFLGFLGSFGSLRNVPHSAPVLHSDIVSYLSASQREARRASHQRGAPAANELSVPSACSSRVSSETLLWYMYGLYDSPPNTKSFCSYATSDCR
jgi:hypothetical protein